MDKRSCNNCKLSKVTVDESCDCGMFCVESCSRLVLFITITLIVNFVNYVQVFSFFRVLTLFWFEWMKIKLMSMFPMQLKLLDQIILCFRDWDSVDMLVFQANNSFGC